FNGRWDMGLLFEPETMEQKRAIIALVYGDSDLHQANQRQRQRRISLTEGVIFLVKTATYHALENFTFLTHLFWTRLIQRVSRLVPLSGSQNPSS
ncbi:MAG: hypothetical protein ACPL3S_01280, partial [Halothiobacillaceae bacterium]